ncbi:hypothetical protein Pmar_PMAR026754, partial [Perkinsus marinus ATCC 50983]
MTYTLEMNGPCLMSPTSNRLVTNTFSWTRKANGIWIDTPVPAGFSIGAVESGWDNLMQSFEEFVNEFFKQHQDLNHNVHLVGLSAS